MLGFTSCEISVVLSFTLSERSIVLGFILCFSFSKFTFARIFLKAKGNTENNKFSSWDDLQKGIKCIFFVVHSTEISSSQSTFTTHVVRYNHSTYAYYIIIARSAKQIKI